MIPGAMPTTGPRADLRSLCLPACAAQRTKDAGFCNKLPRSNHPPPHNRSPLRDTDRQTQRRRSPRRKNPFPHFPESTHEPRPGHRRGAKPHFDVFPNQPMNPDAATAGAPNPISAFSRIDPMNPDTATPRAKTPFLGFPESTHEPRHDRSRAKSHFCISPNQPMNPDTAVAAQNPISAFPRIDPVNPDTATPRAKTPFLRFPESTHEPRHRRGAPTHAPHPDQRERRRLGPSRGNAPTVLPCNRSPCWSGPPRVTPTLTRPAA
jgi:hypothetical protein